MANHAYAKGNSNIFKLNPNKSFFFSSRLKFIIFLKFLLMRETIPAKINPIQQEQGLAFLFLSPPNAHQKCPERQ